MEKTFLIEFIKKLIIMFVSLIFKPIVNAWRQKTNDKTRELLFRPEKSAKLLTNLKQILHGRQ